MSYTVKQLAKLSGISPRALRFYDEIDLLKPAYYGDNQYRHYEEEQLLMLQQILFYRELGFPLSDIQVFMSSPDFDKVETLMTHKKTLQSSLEKTKTLIKTIDKTVSHLRGETSMHAANIYDGFQGKMDDALNEFKNEHYKNLLEHGVMSEEEIKNMEAAEEALKTWKMQDFVQFQSDIDEILRAFVTSIEENLAPEAPEVQTLVQKHYDLMTAMSGQYSKGSYYRFLTTPAVISPKAFEMYEGYHPNLMSYLESAVKFFAESEAH